MYSMPNSPRTAAARRIQARVRGMQARNRFANPGTNIGQRAITAMFHRPLNMAAEGARLRINLNRPRRNQAARTLQRFERGRQSRRRTALARTPFGRLPNNVLNSIFKF